MKNSQEIILRGIGISLVDSKPTELAYVSFEGIVFKQDLNVYLRGSFEKTFENMSLSLRNFQIDQTEEDAYPILLGPRVPFRNIERQYKKLKGIKDKNDKKDKKIAPPFIYIKLDRSEEYDGTVKTKSINLLEVALVEIEMQLHLSFIMRVQALLYSLGSLTTTTDSF